MKPTISPQFIGADVFTLSITLAVFVMITVFLLAFIILLFASTKFRSAFFGNGKGKRKTTKKDKAPSPSEPSIEQSSPVSEMPTEPAQKQPSRRKKSDDPVPTVPIDFPFTPAVNQGRRNEPTYANTFERQPTPRKARSTTNTYDQVPTVFIPRTTARPTGTPVTPAKRSAAPKKTETASVEAEIPATVKTVPLVSASAKKTKPAPTATAADKKAAKSSGAAPKTKK